MEDEVILALVGGVSTGESHIVNPSTSLSAVLVNKSLTEVVLTSPSDDSMTILPPTNCLR